MKIVKKIVGILMAIVLVLGAVGHFFSPEAYAGFIPEFLPDQLVNWGTGIVQLTLGIGVFISKYRKKALLGIAVLMLLLLPIHIIDLLKENPVIGTKTVAMVRLVVQFAFIYLPWFASKD